MIWFIITPMKILGSHSRHLLLIGLLLALLLGACQVLQLGDNATPTAARTLPPPQVFVTSIPDAGKTAEAYLQKWQADDYPGMYALLAAQSQRDVTQEQFLGVYENVVNEAAVISVDYQILAVEATPNAARVTYRLTLNSAILGAIERETAMELLLEQGTWRVRWDPTIILPELANGNYLLMDRDQKKRGTIYDRNGQPLAIDTEAAAIGIYPDYIDLQEKYAPGLISLLATVTGYRSDTLREFITNAYPGDYIPLGEVAIEQDPRRIEILSTYGAVLVSRYSTRFYYGNGIAPHVVGYISQIQKEEISQYRRLGYRVDEKVGRKGLELWGEQILTGAHGGTLYVINPDGKPIGQLGSAAGQPGKDIYTTLDRDLQAGAQKAMSVFRGAIVVLERDTGRVLAMASTPSFDPNAFQTENYNWNVLINRILSDPALPQFNRAAEGQYPLGSVFKLVNISAALETGRYTPETTYQCGYVFDELPGFPRYDWTYERFQRDGVTQPSGLLTLPEGLIRSCNPFFWHIGLDLYRAGLTTAISDMARNFGLGSKTGIVGIAEEAGNIPDPVSEVDAINLAIGQGDMLVTPLQVAMFTAALGNGGTLYTPQLIEKITSVNGEVEQAFQPLVRGQLPIKPENLKVIQEAMVGVVRSQIPPGTAYRAFVGLDIPVAGKTGTATTAVGDPHAWFAGYTFANRPDKPDIAIAVIAENAGEGSEFAAPIFRRIVEIYFYGRPLRPYRWEATFDVTRSPTPIITETPTPIPGFSP